MAGTVASKTSIISALLTSFCMSIELFDLWIQAWIQCSHSYDEISLIIGLFGTFIEMN